MVGMYQTDVELNVFAKIRERKYVNFVLLITVFLYSVVPSQPSEFKGEAKSETSILLSWVAPPQGGPDNQITGYELVYRRADDTEEVRQDRETDRLVADRTVLPDELALSRVHTSTKALQSLF